jgi:hypothetical protein
MGKLKDKAIGTKEEREAAKREQALVIGFPDTKLMILTVNALP